MGDDREAAALFTRDDLVRLDGHVRHAVASFVGVELPDGWAPASFHLPAGSVATGDEIGVAGIEDAAISGDKRRGLRVMAVRIGKPPRYLVVSHEEPSGGGEGGGGPGPTKDDMDWSDI